MGHRVYMKLVSGAAVALLTTAGIAAPGDGPDLNVSATVDGRISSDTLAGTSIGGNNYSYSSTMLGDDYFVEWQMIVNHDAGSGVDKGYESMNGLITVANTGSKTMSFIIDTNINVALAGDPVLYGGSLSGSLTGGVEGAILSQFGDDPLWSAILNDDAYQSFYSDFEFTTMPFETTEIPPAAFGEPIPDLPGPDTFMMGSLLAFELNAGSTVSFGSTFVAQIPGPGSLVILSLGLAGARRRRRN